MTARWRLGTRNPFTVYRVADGAHGVDHGGYFLGSFRREEDARRAVDAVNAAAPDVVAVAERYRILWGYDELTDPCRHAAALAVRMVKLAATEQLTTPTPPACDCPTTDGAVHLTLVSKPKRRGGDVTVGHTGWRVEAAVETVRAGDPLDAWVPQWISREQAGLLERFVAVLDGENDGVVHDGDTCQSADSDLESAQGELNEARLWLARRGVDVKAHRSLTWALNEAARAGVVGRPATDPAGSAVGQRDAPTRDVLVEAFRAAEVKNAASDRTLWEPLWTIPSDDEAERMADVALAALRDGGADTGGEDEDVADPCAEDYRGECAMPGHDHSESRRRTAMWTKPNSRTGQFANVPAASIARDEVTGIKAVLRDRSIVREDDDSLADTVAETLDGHTRDVARLATALGVSLDPDDPDPVGTLVEAAGKAREVEVVSGAEAAELPEDSIVVQADEDGEPLPESSRYPARTIGYLDDDERTDLAGWPDARVLYRAPVPAPAALAVGEVVESAADLDRRASVGTALRELEGDRRLVERAMDGQWYVPNYILGPVKVGGPYGFLPARVVDVPEPVVRVGTGGGET